MPAPPCSDFQLHDFITYSNLSAPTTISHNGGFGKAPTSTVITATISYSAIQPSTSGSTSAIWLQTGPGPVYTDAVLLAQLNGVHAGGSEDQRQFLLSTVLPGVNRPFDWQIDRWQMRGTFQAQGLDSTSSISLDVCGMAPAVVTDCCPEVLAKLDEILGRVGKVFSNQP